MNIGFLTLTSRAEALLVRLAHGLGGVYEPRPPGVSAADWLSAQLTVRDALVVVGDLPLIVRALAPHVRPAGNCVVAAVDAAGAFALPVLDDAHQSAYELCERLALLLGAATPRREDLPIFPVDAWARRRGFFVENPAVLTKIRAAQVREKPVGFFTEAPHGPLPSPFFSASTFQLGVAVTPRAVQPFAVTLWLRPPVLTVGVELVRALSATALEEAIAQFLSANAFSPFSLAAVAVAQWQAAAPELRDFCDRADVPLRVFSKRELILAQSAGGFTSRTLSVGTQGVDSVCERAAALCGRLAVPPKHAAGAAVSLALAVEDYPLAFDDAAPRA